MGRGGRRDEGVWAPKYAGSQAITCDIILVTYGIHMSRYEQALQTQGLVFNYQSSVWKNPVP